VLYQSVNQRWSAKAGCVALSVFPSAQPMQALAIVRSTGEKKPLEQTPVASTIFQW
jgi:hypothetical protein